MKKSEKERLIRKFSKGDNTYEEFPRINTKEKKKIEKPNFIDENDLDDYEKKFQDTDKNDLLKRIIHLEALNLYQERIIERQQAMIKNLKIEKEELLKDIRKQLIE